MRTFDTIWWYVQILPTANNSKAQHSLPTKGLSHSWAGYCYCCWGVRTLAIRRQNFVARSILSSAWGHNTLALAILCFVKAWPCLHHRGAILRDPHKEPRLEDLGRGITSHLNALADKLPPSAATFPFRTLVLCRICIPDGSSLLASILSPTEWPC